MSLLKNLISLTISVVSVYGIISLQKPFLHKVVNFKPEDYRRQSQIKESQLKLIKKSPNLGFSNLWADWLYLDSIQHYGDTNARDVTGYSLLPEYYELIVKRDPRFVNVYSLLDTGTTLFAGKPEVSVELMNYGLNYLQPEIPLAYQVWTYKGINELLFLAKTSEAQKSFEKAAEWGKIENTERSLAISQRMTEMAQFLSKNPDSRLARASSWMLILGNAREQVVKDLALAKLEELGAEVTFTDNTVSVKMPKKD